ncbi:CcoQ/FixQ family Cbb3-type cytochrome c oxidase assembly chaperone [Pseudomonas sp. COW5]|uniref:cbb3-type cytochrome oxidase subunit 3 n=1 Tax=Pseudomonas sp. COW5 TaxID=2981253 RepID=UPI00224766F9|nr:CcoQ/FixQ family Cbb3-type cytochrome c oxidase assembly chaperone [Pseudomonas sp. COW5]MCX2541550.1 CcoQ/FixQ family Cbb3-type cytochrome c oxidase assembly chaperone [Pseudomonas sp. COW5]
MALEMSVGLIRGLGTVVVFLAFVGLTLWVFNRKRTPEFAEARLLPFADEPQPDPTQASETRSTRP